MTNVVSFSKDRDLLVRAELHALAAYDALVEHGHRPGTPDFRLLASILFANRANRWLDEGQFETGFRGFEAWLRICSRRFDEIVAERTGGAHG